MNDITIAELAATFSAADPLQAWWTAAAELPADTTTNEFFARTLKAAADAAAAKNVSLAAGSRINGYPPAANGAIQQDAQGNLSFIRSATVQSRVAVGLTEVISPSI